MKFTFFEEFFDPSINTSILITAILVIVILLLNITIRKQDPTKPSKGVMMLLEMLVDGVNGFCKDNFGKYWKTYAAYILTLGLFLVASNTSGVFGVRPPTASWNVTLALALITFFTIHISGIVTKGLGKYLKGFAEPLPFLLPINLVGELAVPVSLSLRLFGNIFSGMVITGIVYAVLGNFAFIVAPALHAVFDIFFGIIQVAVFILLTTIFVSGQLDLEEE